MSSPDRNTPPRSFTNLDATNTSVARFEEVPQRLERSSPVRQDFDSTQPEGKDEKLSFSSQGGSKILAASALTSLVKPGADDTGVAKAGAERAGQEEASEEEFVIPEQFTKSGRKKATPFPLKLMKVLANKEYHDVIDWLPDGKAFTVFRPKVFVQDILPKEFKQAKFSSFTRKLHRWGFQRHLRGPHAGAFYHKDFQRGRPELVDNMKCTARPEYYSTTPQSQPQGADTYGYDRMYLQQFMASGSAGMPPSSMPAMQQQQQGYGPAEYMAQLQRQQQQLQQQLQQEQQFLQAQAAPREPRGSMGGESAGGSMVVPETMDAAIEQEVSRRLQERIQAANMSRQALSVMQQQMQQQQMPQQMQQQFPVHMPQFGMQMNPAAMQAWNPGAISPGGSHTSGHTAMGYPVANPMRSPHSASLGAPSSPGSPPMRDARGRSGSGNDGFGEPSM